MGASDLRALVIDDQHTMRSILITMMRKLDITKVDEAENGVHAVEFLLKSPDKPDFIICDLYMEKGGGIDFINRMRRHENLKELNIPVILLTGECDQMILDVGRQVGASAVLCKPCSLPDLAKTIGHAVGFNIAVASSMKADV